MGPPVPDEFLGDAWRATWEYGRILMERDQLAPGEAFERAQDALMRRMFLAFRGGGVDPSLGDVLDEFIKKYEWFTGQTGKTGQSGRGVTPDAIGLVHERLVAPSRGRLAHDLGGEVPDDFSEYLFGGRRPTGTFYTPRHVAKFACERTILAHIFPGRHPNRQSVGVYIESVASRPGGGEELASLRERLEQVRVLDPAAGAGDFLLEAAETLLDVWLRLGDSCRAPTDPLEAGTKILTRNLFGTDTSRSALDACRYRLWLWLESLTPREGERGTVAPNSLPALDDNLKVGNALFGSVEPVDGKFTEFLTEKARKKRVRVQPLEEFVEKHEPFHWPSEFPSAFGERGGFDIVLGNPPYGRLKDILEDPAEKRGWSAVYRAAYDLQYGNVNLYKLFLERAYSLLGDGGYFCMIFPAPFLGEQGAAKLREFLFTRTRVTDVLHFKKGARIFQDVTQELAILAYQKRPPPPGATFTLSTNLRSADTDIGDIGKVVAVRLPLATLHRLGSGLAVPVLTDPELDLKVLEAMSLAAPFSGDATHPPVGFTGEGHLHESQDKAFFSKDPGDELLIRRMRLGRYHLDLDKSDKWREAVFLRDRDGFLERKPSAKEFTLKYRDVIVGKELLQVGEERKLQFAVSGQPLVCGNSVRFVVVTDAGLDPFYILALLNSSPMEWFFRVFSWTYHVKKYEVDRLPVPRIGPLDQAPLAKLARLLQAGTTIARSAAGTGRVPVGTLEYLDDLLDLSVFELYLPHLDNGLRGAIGRALAGVDLSEPAECSEDALAVSVAYERLAGSKEVQERVRLARGDELVRHVLRALRD
ncbi:MAG: Eco57I restriction-modification methylase domain-containing protein [Promethearchaeota archaeon]